MASENSEKKATIEKNLRAKEQKSSDVASGPLPLTLVKPEIGADHFPDLIKICSTYMEDASIDLIQKAYMFAADYHKDQKRRSGEPYINHPVEVALILAQDLRMGPESICAALLHDTVEDTSATKEQLAGMFGESVAELVDGVTKLTNIDVSSIDEKQALNLRKMFLAISKDMRVLIVKLADRLHNMRTLIALPPDRRIFKAHETMDVYAPLADRLGMNSIKWELEDLAFFYLEPEAYQRIARMVQESREQRMENTESTIRLLDKELKDAGLSDFQIKGRPKHLWSIYQKMQRKDKRFSDIYDLIALRVIVNSVGDCYSALGAVHTLWHPLPGRFKDYIATPKANLYQSLHTTVIGPEARPIEIQIRSYSMHEQAEYGIAAHWLYKRSGNSKGNMTSDDKVVDTQINYIRRILDWTVETDINDASEFLQDLRVDLYDKDIFIFTPKGEVMSLRKDSTPLDFAYAVHTEVGNHCVGAKVNGAVVPLSTTLEMGDCVEILTNKNARPSADWINIVHTPSARSKIRRYFSSINKDADAELGRSMLSSELRKKGYGISTRRSVKAIEQVADESPFSDVDGLFAAVGSNKITAKAVCNKIEAILEEGSPEQLLKEQKAADDAAILKKIFEENKPLISRNKNRNKQNEKKKKNSGVVVKGDKDLAVHLAHCCNPVAGDEILGFITRGRGVSVHRANCPNIKDLMNHPERMIDVAWDASGATEYDIEIVVEATDRMGLLKDVTIAIADGGGNILSAATQTSPDGFAKLRFLVSISDASLLDSLLACVSRVPSVFDARRIMPGEGGKDVHTKE